MEIVTEPDLANGNQARQWLSRLRQTLRYLGVCDGNMETGSLRCDANVGLKGDHELAGAWVELKNLNSFKWVGQAIDFEIQRLKNKLEKGDRFQHETRSWDPQTRKTKLLRLKENTAEYRFFPEPDLPLLVIEPSEILDAAAKMPELPSAREKRIHADYGVPLSAAVTFCRSLSLAGYFESCAQALGRKSGIGLAQSGVVVSGWVLSDVLSAVGGKDDQLSGLNLNPGKLAEILTLLVTDTIGRTRARMMVQHVLENVIETNISDLARSLEEIENKNTTLLSDLCEQVLEQNPQRVQAFREGKTGLLNFFIGQVMSLCKGSLEADKVRKHLLKMLI